MFARGIQRSLCFVSISNCSVLTSKGKVEAACRFSFFHILQFLIHSTLINQPEQNVRVCCYSEEKRENIKECQPSVKNFFIYFSTGCLNPIMQNRKCQQLMATCVNIEKLSELLSPYLFPMFLLLHELSTHLRLFVSSKNSPCIFL